MDSKLLQAAQSLSTYSNTLPHISDILGDGLKVSRRVVTLGNEDIVVVARRDRRVQVVNGDKPEMNG